MNIIKNIRLKIKKKYVNKEKNYMKRCHFSFPVFGHRPTM